MDEIKDLIVALRASRDGMPALLNWWPKAGGGRLVMVHYNRSLRPIWDLENKANHPVWPNDVEPSPAAAELGAAAYGWRRRDRRYPPPPSSLRSLALAWLDEWEELLGKAAEHTRLAVPELKRAQRLRELLT